MFVCVKGITCLRMTMTAYCFRIFGSIFGTLFCFLIKKLIWGDDTVWRIMRKFLWTVWSVSTFSHMDKVETFLSWKLHNVFIRPEKLNLNISENLAALTFLREKVSAFSESKWHMYTLWLLITLITLIMPKGLVT